MASVALTKCWLNDAADLSSSVSFYSADRSDNTSTPGEVRRYAGGRLRLVSRQGSARTIGLTARALTAAQLEVVQSFSGRVVLFRDVLGRKVYGVYLSVDVDDFKDRSGHDVKLTIQQVSYTEEV